MNDTITEPEVKALIFAEFEAERKRENLGIIELRSRLNIVERKLGIVRDEKEKK